MLGCADDAGRCAPGMRETMEPAEDGSGSAWPHCRPLNDLERQQALQALVVESLLQQVVDVHGDDSQQLARSSRPRPKRTPVPICCQDTRSSNPKFLRGGGR